VRCGVYPSPVECVMECKSSWKRIRCRRGGFAVSCWLCPVTATARRRGRQLDAVIAYAQLSAANDEAANDARHAANARQVVAEIGPAIGMRQSRRQVRLG